MSAKAEQERLFPRQLKRVYLDYNTPTDRTELLPTTLPEICMDLRMACNGAADPWEREFLESVVKMLKMRDEQWSGPTDSMDAGVRQMLQAAIFIGSCELGKM